MIEIDIDIDIAGAVVLRDVAAEPPTARNSITVGRNAPGIASSNARVPPTRGAL